MRVFEEIHDDHEDKEPDHKVKHADHVIDNSESSPLEFFKLFLILLAIIFVSWYLSGFGSGGLEAFFRWFMGVFFMVFASFKLISYQMFTMMFARYDIVAKRFKVYAYAYPFIELALGFAYLINLAPGLRELFTILIMGIGSIGVAQEINKRSGIHCACLGNVIKLPLSTVSLIEDEGMALMALAMLLLR